MHRSALGLAGRTPLSIGPEVAELARIAQADPGLLGEGLVPGVVYGGGNDPIPFQVESRVLRLALSLAGAVLDLSVDGEDSTPVVVKELTRHPVTGAAIHVDLLRVRLDRPIQATVTLEPIGTDGAPGGE